jgi:hypothetical protein
MVPEVGEADREKSAAVLELVPVRLTVCGLAAVLSVTLKLPVRVPDAVGENVTLMTQFPPTAREPPQLLVSAKSPLVEIVVIAKAAEPVFVSVTVCAALVVPTFWLAKVSETGERLAVVVDGVAVPVRPTVCGLPGALSLTLKLPVRVPDAVGVNVTLMAQFPPAARELPQLSVSAKSPLVMMLVMVRVAVPVFDSVTVCAALVVPTVWLAKVSEVGERLAVVVDSVPVPVRPTVCGLPEALSLTLKLPVRVPDAVGVNVTLMVQFPPAARELPQLLVSAKSPLAMMLLIVRVALPVLESVTVCAALVVPTVWLEKVSELGETLATGAGPEVPKNSVISGAVAAPPNPLKLAPSSSAVTRKVLS